MVSPLYKFWLCLRSAFFWVLFLPNTIFFGLLLLLIFFTPLSVRIAVVKLWISFSLFALRWTCGLTYEIEGQENIPEQGFIVMSKHSSTWETIAIQHFFRPMVWVVKRELTWIPVFGWALKVVDAIALNRGTGRQAFQQLVDESGARMAQGAISDAVSGRDPSSTIATETF